MYRVQSHEIYTIVSLCNLKFLISAIIQEHSCITLVNVYVDLVVFTRIAGLHRPEVVDIGVNTIKKNMPYA